MGERKGGTQQAQVWQVQKSRQPEPKHQHFRGHCKAWGFPAQFGHCNAR